MPEFTNVPIVLQDLEVELSAEEFEALQKVRLPVYGNDDAAALRDVFFTWWEQRFLGAAESGAPAIGNK